MIEELKSRKELLEKSIEISSQQYNTLLNQLDQAKANHNALIGRLEETKTLMEMCNSKNIASNDSDDGNDAA